MDYGLSDEHQQIRDEVRRFADSEIQKNIIAREMLGKGMF